MATNPGYNYRCKFVKAHDPDTVRLEVDLGFRIEIEIDVRIKDFRAPELSTEEGQRLQAECETVLYPLLVLGGPHHVQTFKPTYQRWEGILTLDTGEDYRTVVRTIMKNLDIKEGGR